MRNRLSVALITLNAATEIEACLASVAFADEIIVVDSGSSDGTPDIAKKHGARVIEHAWMGYGRQKQIAVEAASNDWVLALDADERVSQELRVSIVAALENPTATAYEMARCNRFMGRWLRHGEGYPDWSVRFFHRGHARWSEDVVHERVIAHAAPMRLRGDLLHESAESLPSYLDKQNRYTTLQAEQLFAAGGQSTVARLMGSPLLRFIKFYFLRLGFLDGVPGLVHVSIGCMNSFNKYAKAMALQRASQLRDSAV